MASDVEVKAELSLDDLASEVLDRIKDGFKETDAERAETQSGFDDFSRDFAATFAAVNLVPLIGQLRQFGEEVAGIAIAADDAAQNIAGFLAGTAGRGWEEARMEGEALHRTMVQIGIDVGQSSTDIETGFKRLVTWMGGGERAFQFGKGQIRDLTQIANVMGFSVEQVSHGIGAMAAGFVQTESPMFALMRNTGIFANDISKVTQEWQKLTQEERLSRLEGAIAGVAGNLGKAEPTMSDLIMSLREAGKLFVESFGMPFVEQLKPSLERLTGYLEDTSGGVEAFARQLGRDVGQWVERAAAYVESGFEYIRTHSEEIKQAIVDAFTWAKEVVSFIIDHKEEIAIAFGARAAMPALGALRGGAGAVMEAGAKGGTVFGMKALSGAGGALYGLGALTLAIGGVAMAADQAADLFKEAGGALAVDFSRPIEDMLVTGHDLKAMQDRIVEMARSTDVMTDAEYEWFVQLETDMNNLASQLDADATAAEQLAKAARRAQNEQRNVLSEFQTAARDFEAMIGWGGKVPQEMLGQGETLGALWQDAVNANRKGQMAAMAQIVGGSAAMQKAFLQSADLTAEGFMKLAELVKNQAADFAKDLEERGKKKKDDAAKPKAPSIHMSGGQTFKIKQDFREGDPDRILVAFRQDMARAATRRLQARTSTPFGT